MDFPAKDASLSNKLELRCQKKVVAYYRRLKRAAAAAAKPTQTQAPSRRPAGMSQWDLLELLLILFLCQ